MTSSENQDMTGAFPVTHQPGATSFPGSPSPSPAQGPVVHPQMQYPPQATPEDPYAPKGWSSPYEDFTAPSGQRCLLKKLDLTDLISAGLLEQFDALGGIVDNELIRPAQGQPPVDVGKVLKDPAKLASFLPIIDRVLMLVVERPTLYPKPGEGEELVPGRAYIHAVSLTDKIAIFNRAAGDLEDLKSLRKEP